VKRVIAYFKSNNDALVSSFIGWQKKGLAIRSVNGKVMVTPPQLPVSACKRVDKNGRLAINEMRTKERTTMERLNFKRIPLR
jgi:hypothetical protein